MKEIILAAFSSCRVKRLIQWILSLKMVFDVRRQKTLPLMVSYFNLFYFFEIVYVMIALFAFYGKFVSVITGLIASLLLVIHIICLYMKREINRKIQLFLMELHVVYTIPAFAQIFISGWKGSWMEGVFIVSRLIIIVVEVFLVFLLTDEELKNQFAS